jgi:hypothetical protein
MAGIIKFMDNPETTKIPNWRRVGVWLSALWIGLILVATEGRMDHPLFDYIFTVPLAAWIVAVVAARAVARRKKR